MKRKLSIGLVAVAAVVAALLGAHGSAVRAQPVASIALPEPGASVQLYPGCNNIGLTFPDGTASETVVQAVTPAGVVEAMWRHDAALNKFEGFSPAAPQASDLLTVNFLDAVWLCMAAGPPPAPTPPPTEPTATPVASPPTATPPAIQTPAAGSFVSPTDVLESFAYALEMGVSMEADGGFDITAATEGEFEAPDRLTCTTSMSLGPLMTLTNELVVIGGDAWLDTGEGFRATSVDDPEVVDSLGGCPGSPMFWEDFGLDAEDLSSLSGQPETVNGVAAIRYSLGELLDPEELFGLLPPELEGMTIHAFDIWLAEDGGWLVRLIADISLQAEGGEETRLTMRLDITDPNSPDIHVEPPVQ